jgi:hypothetical protein
MSGINSNLFKKGGGIQTRWASRENPKGSKGKGGIINGGRKGSPFVTMLPGESFVVAEEKGISGTVRRIWATIRNNSPEMLRSMKLDFYWDGSDKPSFSVPFGDFFGHGLGRMFAFDSAMFSNPEGRSFNCFVPMPFKTGMKIVVTNESDQIQPALYYDVDYTIGDMHDDDSLYFFAHYRRENKTRLREDFAFLPKVEGEGRFLGVNVGVIVNQKDYLDTWWGEGEVKIYLDGDSELPTLCGTGTEDYIGTAWALGQYSTPYQGCPLADFENGQFTFYRYHILDPVFFYQDIRATIQQIGFCNFDKREALAKMDRTFYRAAPDLEEFDLSNKLVVPPYLEREDDFSSCAYFYLNSPRCDLPELDDVKKRTEGLLDKSTDSVGGSDIPEDFARAYFKYMMENRAE